MLNIHMNDPYKDFCNWHHVSRDCPSTVCHLLLRVSWGSFQSPKVPWQPHKVAEYVKIYNLFYKDHSRSNILAKLMGRYFKAFSV